MSEFNYLEPSSTAFHDHPFRPHFVEAAFESYDLTGNWRITDERRRELMSALKLGLGETAALAYMAEHYASNAQFSIELDLFIGDNNA